MLWQVTFASLCNKDLIYSENYDTGLVPLPGAGIYTATKYGIEGFMESLRAELRLSDCDYVRTTVANAYLMRTSGDLPLLSDAG